MNFLMKINKSLNKLLTLTGGVLLLAMIILTCANIFIRQFYIPIRGTFELMGYAGAVVTAFALGYTQFTNGHICVDILVNTYPAPVRRGVAIFNHTICCIFFVLAAWQITNKAMTLKNAGELSETLRIIYYPFTLAVAFGCFVLALALFTDLLKAVLIKKESEK
jgi:TRAP-type C4-dicarboxylate transport system permease small subunit